MRKKYIKMHFYIHFRIEKMCIRTTVKKDQSFQ